MPQSNHDVRLGPLLPLFASVLALEWPTMGTAIGQALLHAAKSSPGIFKEAEVYVGAGERQALKGTVRTAMLRMDP